jgi:hypothetical protein
VNEVLDKVVVVVCCRSHQRCYPSFFA